MKVRTHRLRRALRVGAQFMKKDEGFDDHVFELWHSCVLGRPKHEAIAALFDPEDKNWQRQWLIVATLGNAQDETYWKLFQLAYDEGIDPIRDIGRWALEQTNEKRFKDDQFVVNFFWALAAFAQMQIEAKQAAQDRFIIDFFEALACFANLKFNQSGGQLTLL